jgi:transposase
MTTRIIEMVGIGPRRRFSYDDKTRIVSEAMMPGASVPDVTRHHRVCMSLVYRWRRTLLRDGVAILVEGDVLRTEPLDI